MRRALCQGAALACTVLVAGCAGSAQPSAPVAQSPAPRSDGPCLADGVGKPIGNGTADQIRRRCTPGHRREPAPGADTIRHRAMLCFSDAELRLDAGEALGSIQPGDRFPGRRRIILENFHGTIGNVERSLHIAQRYADAEARPAVDRITRLAHGGIHQLRRHPALVVYGGIPAFRRADTVARRAGLRSCLS
jgi:hypothetical protein